MAYSSLAIGADGLPLVSYLDNANVDLKVAHCNDIACATSTATTIASTGNVGLYTSLTIGADGLGLVSFRDASASVLDVAHCNNLACSSADAFDGRLERDRGRVLGDHARLRRPRRDQLLRRLRLDRRT